MIPVAIDAISPDHLHSLVANAVREGRTIEYKQTLPGGSDADKKEFLADVSSFANATGGDLIYGVAAANGVPTAIGGLSPFDPDKDVLRIESAIRDGIEPRILGLRTRVIDGLDEGPVLIVRVPKSWSGPHMVTFKGSSRFFARSSAGKFQMDVEELRSAFALAGDLPERIRSWRDERIAKIMADDTPVPLINGPKMILHLVPLDSFSQPNRIAAADLAESKTGFVPIGVGGWSHRLNLDGYLNFGGRSRDDDSKRERSYCQVFLSGRVEAVCDTGQAADGTPVIASVWYEKEILESTASFLRSLQTFDVHPPAVLLVSFVGVKGVTLTMKPGYGDMAHPIDRDVLLLPDVLIEEMPRDLTRLLRPIFDAVWNACGIAQSWNFDDKGNWREGALSGVPQEVLK